MPSLSQQLENWLKPLRLEEKQDYSNRSVVKGLDRYLMRQCEDLLKGSQAGFPDGEGFPLFLKDLRSTFSQYMTLSHDERKQLVLTTRRDLENWIQQLPKEAAVKKV